MTRVGRRVAPGVALIAVSLVIGSLVTWVGTPQADFALVADASALRDGATGEAFSVVSELGYSRGLVPLTIVAAGLLWLVRRRTEAFMLAFTMLVVFVGNWLVKQGFARLRPDHGLRDAIAGFSMPSGHASASAAFATAIVLSLHDTRGPQRAAVVVLALFAAAVGVSRVVLGVHFPSDVVAGWCLGAGAALLLDALRIRKGSAALEAG